MIYTALRLIFISLAALIMTASASADDKSTPRLDAVKTIIQAVNQGDADLYASVFANDMAVKMHDGEIKVSGKAALQANRARHFKAHPQAYSEIQHLVEIAPFVIMHDRVWLDGKDGPHADIVEIFTFNADDQITEVEVIQPANLFAPQSD